MNAYDAIVVGAGAGGGTTAMVLAQRGLNVLLVDRGQDLHFEDERRDHLRNHRTSRYGHNTGPDAGHPRSIEGRPVLPWEGGYHNNASAIGGGTLVYGAQAWRFMPEDFQMASLYGVPAGSSLVDWPFSLDELAPYYQLAEEFFGVCGDAPLPMPPMQSTIRGRILRTAAEGLGWKTRAVPLLINSVERHGRRACIQCGHCVGFQCPVGAKSGTQNTAIPTAKATGNCTVWPNADVLQILFAEQRAVGVRLLRQGRQEDVLADRVIVSAGAIESARLLLLSGIANDHLGRHLQGHYYPGAWGVMPDPVFDGIGPGVTTATTDFNHGNEGVIGGAMLADDFIMVPSSFALNFNDPNGSRWGLKYKDWIRYTYPRLIEVKGPVHEIPSPTSRVDLDYGIRDALGRPVARLSGATHPETARTANFMNGVAKQWLESAGAAKIQVRTHGVWLSGGQHQAGTCRMSDDPSQGVTDQFGKVHRQEGLYVADGSLHPTNGGFNPVLTIMANSWRVAANIT